MSNPELNTPKINIATEPWTSERLTDTENRIEKAFHDQTRYFDQKFQSMQDRSDSNMKWMIGLLVSSIVALIVAVLVQPLLMNF